MLNEMHKFLISTTIKAQFFDYIEDMPVEIQQLACESALSLKVYLKNIEKLKDTKFKYKNSVTTISKTASPKNSKRSL